jgi:hypothetical protein
MGRRRVRSSQGAVANAHDDANAGRAWHGAVVSGLVLHKPPDSPWLVLCPTFSVIHSPVYVADSSVVFLCTEMPLRRC